MTAQAYATFTTIKNRLGIGVGDTTDDTFLTTVADQVNSWLEGRIGFPVGPINSVERTFDGTQVFWDDGGNCYLNCAPFGVRAVTVAKTAASTGASYTTQTASDVLIRPHDYERETDWPGFRLYVKDTATWNWTTAGADVNAVTATWGWAAIPSELSSIAERVGVAAYRARGAGSGRTFAMGDDIEGLAGEELSANDWQTIFKYRDLKVRIY